MRIYNQDVREISDISITIIKADSLEEAKTRVSEVFDGRIIKTIDTYQSQYIIIQEGKYDG